MQKQTSCGKCRSAWGGHRRLLGVVLGTLVGAGVVQAQASPWIDACLEVPYPASEQPAGPVIEVLRQDHMTLQRGRSIRGTPLTIVDREFEHGLGTHSVSHIRLASPEPLARFSAWVGLDHNSATHIGHGSVAFVVTSRAGEHFRSKVLKVKDAPVKVDVELPGVRVLNLHVENGGDGAAYDHADWAEAVITTEAGTSYRLQDLPEGQAHVAAARYPFSFVYGGHLSNTLLPTWKQQAIAAAPLARPGCAEKDPPSRTGTMWTDPESGLRVHWEIVRYEDFPAVEWLLRFENTGEQDTEILNNIHVLDITRKAPRPEKRRQYLLHHTNGAPSNPTDFEAQVIGLGEGAVRRLSGGQGRSSNKDFPFFRVDTAEEAFIVAVGWSGQWQAVVSAGSDDALALTAGLETAHFRLHPGESVRMPRILILHWPEPSYEANAQFRQLIYKHYVAKRGGEKPLPIPYCNTCFTRGGGWLNECNEQNQISLIKAYAPLGLEALLTDAGWFEGGWPNGAGNWTPRKDAYPQGMAPVAAAAKAHDMIYGLWFEPERVMDGTDIRREHPEWCLAVGPEPQSLYLLNFGLPEVQDYFFNIVRGFMELEGFGVYRQDFNMNPLEFWRANEEPDRQGMTEIKYIEGLYAYWERIASNWPDGLRIECSSGGRRIDLETVMRMHVHQKSDYWFHNVVDQASIWGLSQYLPNNVFMTPINRLDDYSFHSALPTSLCLGWIADAEDFDTERGRALLKRYLEVRHLLIGAWYPLMGYSREKTQWIAGQFHRPDLHEGMILVYRRADSRYASIQTALHGLDPEARYELTSDRTGATRVASGRELLDEYVITFDEPGVSDLIHYARVAE